MTAFAPSKRLSSFVRTFTVVEADEETTRTLVPDTGLVLGLRYRGSATQLDDGTAMPLPNAALTGLRDVARRMRTAPGSGIVVATFHEAAAAQFFAEPLHELFGATLALADLVPRAEAESVSSRIAEATDHAQRIVVFEQFLLARRRTHAPDPLVAAAVHAIRETHGSVRIGALATALDIGQDRLEKRFRRAVGASPKQLASIVRLRHAIDSYRPGTSLTQLSVDAGYCDQSHFIRDIRSVTGESPQRFFRADDHC